MLPAAQCRLYMCSCVCLSSAACFCAGFCDVGLNLQNCYLKPTSATQRERVCSAQGKQHTPDTHIPLQTHRNHTLAFILNGHMSFFHSTHPTLVALSLSISPTHTHEVQQHKRWRKRHSRPSCLVTVNPVNGTTVCFLSDSTHLIE